GAVEVVVDGGGDADHGKPHLVQLVAAGLRAVAADDDQAIDRPLGELADGLAPPSLLTKLLGPGAAQHRARLLDDAAHVPVGQPLHLPVDQAGKAVAHAVNFKPGGYPRPHDGANGCVHPWRVTAAGQDRNAFHQRPPPCPPAQTLWDSRWHFLVARWCVRRWPIRYVSLAVAGIPMPRGRLPPFPPSARPHRPPSAAWDRCVPWRHPYRRSSAGRCHLEIPPWLATVAGRSRGSRNIQSRRSLWWPIGDGRG